MSNIEPSRPRPSEGPTHIPALPRVNAVVAVIVAVASLSAASVILILVPGDSGKAAAAGIATAGLALAGRLGAPNR